MTTKAEKAHYSRLADFGCILCHHLELGASPAEIHHIRRFGGKRDNAPVIPLCPEHHRGNNGVHGLGHRGFERIYRVSEHDLLDELNSLLNQND